MPPNLMTRTRAGAPAAVAALPNDARRRFVPAALMGEWLAAIDDLAELKVTLRAVGIVSGGVTRKGIPPSVSLDELLDDRFLAQGIASGHPGIVRGLGAALCRGTLVAARRQGQIGIYLNDDAAQRFFSRAELTPLTASEVAAVAGVGNAVADYPPPDAMPPSRRRANIFALYEQHIGGYTHGVAEQLRAAEEEYPAQWIEYAFNTAAERDVRSWYYVIAILRRWAREGPPNWAVDTYDNGKPGNDTAPDDGTEYLESYRRRYGRLPWESRPDVGSG